jgi:hypothetical protein
MRGKDVGINLRLPWSSWRLWPAPPGRRADDAATVGGPGSRTVSQPAAPGVPTDRVLREAGSVDRRAKKRIAHRDPAAKGEVRESAPDDQASAHGFLALCAAGWAALAQEGERPNILVIWGDDIGQTNLSAYTSGLVGYRTPNIDCIAAEGMMFTDYYGEQSCTAGRASFIMGQSVFRTGLSKVGLPGAELGMREEDPTIAGLLKAEGYATGQFGKNHLGDRDEHLPTNHGFDEFFGNLYHLNAEEEPENMDYPADAALPSGETFIERYGPRGIIRSSANYGEDEITQDI